MEWQNLSLNAWRFVCMEKKRVWWWAKRYNCSINVIWLLFVCSDDLYQIRIKPISKTRYGYAMKASRLQYPMLSRVGHVTRTGKDRRKERTWRLENKSCINVQREYYNGDEDLLTQTTKQPSARSYSSLKDQCTLVFIFRNTTPFEGEKRTLGFYTWRESKQTKRFNSG